MHNYQPQPRALENKIILVTGAGDGIGKEAALQFARYGATLILLGRTVAKLETTYDELLKQGGKEPAIVPLDLKGATPQHYVDMANTIIDQFGRLDGLLHNASILDNLSPFAHISDEQWQDTLQVNLNSNFYMTRALLPALKKSEKASVVFTSSGVGRKGRAFWGAYSVSKFATEGLMQTLADEYQNSNIRFNAINPGATRTDMRAKAYPAEDATKLKTPAQIIPAYVYLMSDDSVEVNGQSVDAQPK